MRHLAREIGRLQTELDREIHRRRDALDWQIRRGLVEFQRDVATRHRELRRALSRFLTNASIGTIVTTPIIYSLVVPLILDLWRTAYLCRPVASITDVQKRASFWRCCGQSPITPLILGQSARPGERARRSARPALQTVLR